MGNLVYPVLPGLTFGNTRSPGYNTGLQAALSGKESRIAYQQYPLMTFELQYELLRDYVTVSDLKALSGLFMACKGKWDTFLFSDPAFNAVAAMQFATTDGVSNSYQITVTYQNAGGPGGAELIQNFNGVPALSLNRFGINEPLSATSRTLYLLSNMDLTNAAWVLSNFTAVVSGTFTTFGGTVLFPTLLSETSTANVQHTVGQAAVVPATTGLDYSFSAYVFPNRNWVQLLMQESTGSQTASCYFNVFTGVIGTSNISGANWSNIRVSIGRSLAPGGGGTGWYKCSITATKNSAGTAIACFVTSATADAAPAYVGAAGFAAFYACGLQLENASVPTATVFTAAAPITQADYTLGLTGIIASTVVYTVGLLLTWTGSFFYRCRFDDDSFTASQFMNKFWENKKVTLKQVKL